MGIFSASLFFHSVLRWGILFTVAIAGITALIGLLRRTPITNLHHHSTVVAMVLCHMQLVIGAILYGLRLPAYRFMAGTQGRYWKMEHLALMVLVILLVTIGRMASSRADTEHGKLLRVAIFYLPALLIMLLSIPWPGTAMGMGRGWL